MDIIDFLVGETKPSFQKINTNGCITKKKKKKGHSHMHPHLKSFWTICSSAEADDKTNLVCPKMQCKENSSASAVLTSSEAVLREQA